MVKRSLAQLNRINRTLAVGLALLSFTLSGCFLRPRSEDDATRVGSLSTEQLSGNRQLVANQTERVQLVIPSGWETVEALRPDADIYVADEAGDMYVLVLADNRETLVGDFSLEDNSSTYRRVIARQLSEVQQSATDLTSVNGKNAVQYEIRGRVEGVPVVYLHTTIRGDDNYYQVVGWTRADAYDSRRGELQEVIASFRGV